MSNRARRVVLLRHGRTEWNATGRFQGQMDSPLDGIGLAQAAAAGVAIVPMEPDAIVASDLSRTADTAAAVSAEVGVPVSLDKRLREIHLGEWQGLTRAGGRARVPPGAAGGAAGPGGAPRGRRRHPPGARGPPRRRDGGCGEARR